MRANRAVSETERRLRRSLWAAGARGFRTGRLLPGRPDVIFPRSSLAVFVHGCYWHRCPTCAPRAVKANADFWQAKFETNVVRDARARETLESSGWAVEIVWEHEIRTDAGAAGRRVAGRARALRHA